MATVTTGNVAAITINAGTAKVAPNTLISQGKSRSRAGVSNNRRGANTIAARSQAARTRSRKVAIALCKAWEPWLTCVAFARTAPAWLSLDAAAARTVPMLSATV